MPVRLALYYHSHIPNLQREEARIAATATAIGTGTLRAGDARAILADWEMCTTVPYTTDLAAAANTLGLEEVRL